MTQMVHAATLTLSGSCQDAACSLPEPGRPSLWPMPWRGLSVTMDSREEKDRLCPFQIERSTFTGGLPKPDATLHSVQRAIPCHRLCGEVRAIQGPTIHNVFMGHQRIPSSRQGHQAKMTLLPYQVKHTSKYKMRASCYQEGAEWHQQHARRCGLLVALKQRQNSDGALAHVPESRWAFCVAARMCLDAVPSKPRFRSHDSDGQRPPGYVFRPVYSLPLSD